MTFLIEKVRDFCLVNRDSSTIAGPLLPPKSQDREVWVKVHCQPRGAEPYCVGGSKFRRKQASFILPDMVISLRLVPKQAEEEEGDTLSNVKC